jgi:hypothetical protein
LTPFASDQFIMLGLMFLLGLVLGMYLLSGGKWKRRYKEEVRRREVAEAELKRVDRMPGGDVIVDKRHHHGSAPVTGSEVPPEPRRGGLLGLGRAKH